jgi:hypothetical protein
VILVAFLAGAVAATLAGLALMQVRDTRRRRAELQRREAQRLELAARLHRGASEGPAHG